MSRKPTTPSREKFLKAYIVCIRRKERSIIMGGRFPLGCPSDMLNDAMQRARVNRIGKRIQKRGFEPYALALSRLQLARSKYQIELENRTFSA